MLGLRFGAAVAAITAALMGSAAAQTITVGTAGTISDAPIFLADKKGYFKDEGLDVTVTPFKSASDMVAPLGTGQLHAGVGSASAGLYNAVARGIKIKIVADKASSAPGYGGTKVLVRRDHVESGRFKDIKDFKGMKFAMNAPGVSNTSTLNTLLKSVGLKYSDVETVDLPLPEHVAAFKNKAVDASVSVEPAPALAIRNGDAVLVKGDDEVLPNHQIAVLLYSEDFTRKQPEAAHKFMRAYIRAVRLYNDALAGGRFKGPAADEVIDILIQATPVKNKELYRAMTPFGMNPDGKVNVESLAYDLAFYREQGLIRGDVKLDQVVDHSFAEKAAKELGPYQKK